MTQLELMSPCRVPPRGTQCYELLMALQTGVRLTVAKALREHACYALSQRMGDLRTKFGWPVQSRFIETDGGAMVKEYWL